jgi:hypothetical protein
MNSESRRQFTTHGISRFAICLFLCSIINVCTAFAQHTWRIEAEDLAVGSPLSFTAWSQGGLDKWGGKWIAESHHEASGGKVLHGFSDPRLEESRGAEVVFNKAGVWNIWARYEQQEHPLSGMLLVIRDADEQVIGSGLIGYDLASAMPDLARKVLPGLPEKPRTKQFLWERFPVTIEYPITARLSVKGMEEWPSGQPRILDTVIITDSPDFDPNKDEWVSLPIQDKSALASIPDIPPTGFVAAGGLPVNARDYSGAASPKTELQFGLVQCYGNYFDFARMAKLGFNRDHSSWGSVMHGVAAMNRNTVTLDIEPDEDFRAKYPYPIGRFKTAEGEISQSVWSYSFDPVWKWREEEIAKRIRAGEPKGSLLSSRAVALEHGGQMDYSDVSQQQFREWLKKKYHSIENLNQELGTSYADFDAITAPTRETGPLSLYLAFRNFNGEMFTAAVKRAADIIKREDPSATISNQSSDAQLLLPTFTRMSPMDWEQFINVGFEGLPEIGVDTYCADDAMGNTVSLLQSLSGDRRIISHESQVHSTDPRIAGRTLWLMLAKGMKGVDIFQNQHGANFDGGPKMASFERDQSPKDRLGAQVDCIMEAHRLENLLSDAKPDLPSKAIYIYYSRIDLSLNAWPLQSTWGEKVNSPVRVYELLRGLGYEVRWITPKQIDEGGLANVGALILSDCQYIPKTAAHKIKDYIHSGGIAIADGWPGAFDGNGKAQNVLADVFGVAAFDQADQGKRGSLALQETTQGYGDVTINAIKAEKIQDTVGEVYAVVDQSHPLAKSLGPFTVSGYGLTRAMCKSGDVVGFTFGCFPGLVVNRFGKGTTLWSSMMLGSLYASSANRHESENIHSGLDAHRILGAFLSYAGLKPYAKSNLDGRIAKNLRVELPLVDKKNNAFVGITSFNEAVTPAQTLTLAWPEALPGPKMAFFSAEGTRNLTQITLRREKGSISLEIPQFDSHCAVILLNDSKPLISVVVSGLETGPGSLPIANPGETFVVRCRLINPSPQKVGTGELSLAVPKGWFVSSLSEKTPAMDPWTYTDVEFKFKTTATCGIRQLKSILAKWRSSDGVSESTPSTTVLWWQKHDDGTTQRFNL